MVYISNIHMGGSVAEWLACWTQAQKGLGSNRATMLSGNSIRQTVHTYHASVHQASKLVAALLRVVRVTVGLAEHNCRVYDSCHLQADCQEPGSTPEPYARQLSMGYLYLNIHTAALKSYTPVITMTYFIKSTTKTRQNIINHCALISGLK